MQLNPVCLNLIQSFERGHWYIHCLMVGISFVDFFLTSHLEKLRQIEGFELVAFYFHFEACELWTLCIKHTSLRIKYMKKLKKIIIKKIKSPNQKIIRSNVKIIMNELFSFEKAKEKILYFLWLVLFLILSIVWIYIRIFDSSDAPPNIVVYYLRRLCATWRENVFWLIYSTIFHFQSTTLMTHEKEKIYLYSVYLFFCVCLCCFPRPLSYFSIIGFMSNRYLFRMNIRSDSKNIQYKSRTPRMMGIRWKEKRIKLIEIMRDQPTWNAYHTFVIPFVCVRITVNVFFLSSFCSIFSFYDYVKCEVIAVLTASTCSCCRLDFFPCAIREICMKIDINSCLCIKQLKYTIFLWIGLCDVSHPTRIIHFLFLFSPQAKILGNILHIFISWTKLKVCLKHQYHFSLGLFHLVSFNLYHFGFLYFLVVFFLLKLSNPCNWKVSGA